MTGQTNFKFRNGLVDKIAKGAMQQRLGKTSDIENELERLETLLEQEEQSFMGRGTPPPDYLMTDARQVWLEVLENAGDMHFKQTEYDLLAQYSWVTASLRSVMATSGALMDPSELTAVVRLQTMARILAIRLRLTPQGGVALKVRERIDNAKAAVHDLKDFVDGPTKRNARSGLMFGDGEAN